MVSGRPLFKGENESDQLEKIFKIKGTPDEDKWDTMKDLPLYNEMNGDIPLYEPMDLKEIFTELSEEGLDLMEAFLQCDPL